MPPCNTCPLYRDRLRCLTASLCPTKELCTQKCHDQAVLVRQEKKNRHPHQINGGSAAKMPIHGMKTTRPFGLESAKKGKEDVEVAFSSTHFSRPPALVAPSLSHPHQSHHTTAKIRPNKEAQQLPTLPIDAPMRRGHGTWPALWQPLTRGIAVLVFQLPPLCWG